MSYDYARGKRKFDAEWKRRAAWYRKEGMNEEDIEAMHRFDLAQFNRDRAYESRLSSVGDACYIQAPETPSERYSWIDDVSSPRLSDRLRELLKLDLELPTLLVVDGYFQAKAPRFWA